MFDVSIASNRGDIVFHFFSSCFFPKALEKVTPFSNVIISARLETSFIFPALRSLLLRQRLLPEAGSGKTTGEERSKVRKKEYKYILITYILFQHFIYPYFFPKTYGRSRKESERSALLSRQASCCQVRFCVGREFLIIVSFCGLEKPGACLLLVSMCICRHPQFAPRSEVYRRVPLKACSERPW